ncbi:hypothetical protein JXM67_06630 [candidate division WOR-3 bacterium]|nr:hypothetical protein [candidate division WOR-3 bacterium]
MNRIIFFIGISALLLVAGCFKKRDASDKEVFSETYEAGEKVVTKLDIDDDGSKEILTVESSSPDPEVEWLESFDMDIRIMKGSNTLYHDTWYGELGWFSIDVAPFELVASEIRQVVLIRTGCSGTGMDKNALFLFMPEVTSHVFAIEDGNEGYYDSDSDGVYDLVCSRYRADHLGGYGYSSPWLSFFSRPSPEDWETFEDCTFRVLQRDQVFRKEWIDGLGYAYDALSELPQEELEMVVKADHLYYLKKLRDALKRNAGEEETANIYYTAFY